MAVITYSAEWMSPDAGEPEPRFAHSAPLTSLLRKRMNQSGILRRRSSESKNPIKELLCAALGLEETEVDSSSHHKQDPLHRRLSIKRRQHVSTMVGLKRLFSSCCSDLYVLSSAYPMRIRIPVAKATGLIRQALLYWTLDEGHMRESICRVPGVQQMCSVRTRLEDILRDT